jgi:hypothetical protein
MDKNRKRVLIDLEGIIGNEFYNAKIQNWGPGGVFEGEGREFRYPIVFRDKEGKTTKTWSVGPEISDASLMTGCYRLGGNELSVMRAVDSIITYFEKNYGLDVKKPAR